MKTLNKNNKSKKYSHTFSKHPAKSSNKAIRAAFKLGVKTGLNKNKRD